MVEENQRVFLLIVLHSFYPLNCVVVDKKRLFYPLQRIYWIKSCIFAIVNVQYTSKYE